MNAEEIAIFNNNVWIERNNTNMLFNATNENSSNINFIYDYLSWNSLWWAGMFVIVSVCLYMFEKWVEELEERIKYLEERLPEREPLLVKI